MLSTSNLSLPEIHIPSLGDWDDIVKTDEDSQQKSKLTRAHSLQRNLSQKTEEGDLRKEVINISTSDPSHLFWVPASQHPEIAPAEFERYVDALGFMVRKKSVKRRQSVLSVYFTANDQPKLTEDEYKEKAASDEEKNEKEEINRKRILRRSVSLYLPNANETHAIPDFLVFDRNSSPFDQSQAIVPKADRRALHRRGARTNFKKNASTVQRPPLTSRKSESDSYSLSPEGVTLVDECAVANQEEEQEQIAIETKEEVKELGIAKRESEPKMTRSVSSSSSRRSAWSWSFWSEEKSKKNKVDPIEPNEMKRTSKSTDIPSRRFTLSSLFSRKSKTNNSTNNNNQLLQHQNIIEEKDGPSVPKDFQLNRMYMTRLPLHVERAIYKLSHVKLANPRRPLKEQVLISNLMFWYLSVISTTEQKPIQSLKLMGKKKRQSKKRVKSSTKGNATLLSNNSLRHHQSTGFVVPENYLNPKQQQQQQQQQSKKKGQIKQLDSSSDDDDDDDDSISSDSSDDDDIHLNRQKRKDDDLPLAMYKIKK
ncbi:hypothetical protein G6F60_004884 [Rhizopus arrhizus]|uniref:Protein Zds1 C-terminal domain-containing protein n=1 Tax=Rhizopus oryzae TaxID=64495 RepID=A0A9P6X6F3_RHIOR|nr:hypothetical protein G6F23_007350 [Rhizopus arrhizus]KAG1306403.1 hypothetical protein G6F64_007622 [Rhizopus arrhizus]KAG1403676.1 hypothetical protein G6F60_004884 [Rhizopus arrhizus]